MKIKLDLLPHVYGEKVLNISDDYHKVLISTIELLRRGDKNGRAMSNYQFGWQIPIPSEGPFLSLRRLIEKNAFSFCKQLQKFSFSEVNINHWWVNINYKNDINWEHTHEGDLSGVYYINATEECGDLMLRSAAIHPTYTSLNSFLLKTYSRKTIKAQNKKLVLFDSTLAHRVLKNLSEELRISVSFNIYLR